MIKWGIPHKTKGGLMVEYFIRRDRKLVEETSLSDIEEEFGSLVAEAVKDGEMVWIDGNVIYAEER